MQRLQDVYKGVEGVCAYQRLVDKWHEMICKQIWHISLINTTDRRTVWCPV